MVDDDTNNKGVDNDGVFDIPEESYSDDTININKYLNIAILTAQKILPNSTLKGDIENGFTAYGLQIEQAEMFARAGGFLSEDYDKDLKEYINSAEIKSITKDSIKSARIANKKLFLIMREIGEKSNYTGEMKA